MNWKDVPDESIHLAKIAFETYAHVNSIRHKFPKSESNYGRIWYNPYNEALFFNVGYEKDLIKLASWKNVFQKTPNLKYLEYSWTGTPNNFEPWIPFKFYNPASLFKQSAAAPPPVDPVARQNPLFKSDAELNKLPEVKPPEYDGPLNAVGQATGFTEGPVANILGGPSPLSATLAGGLLGAGLGYGTGTLLEHLFPERYAERGRARKTMALLGGLGGAAPGVWWGTANYRNNQPLFSKASAFDIDELLDGCELNEQFVKGAEGIAGGDYVDAIHVDKFNNVIWSDNDPYTPLPVRAAASGFVTGAGELSDSSWVSPMDIARVIGGGVIGLTAGRTLGALAGLKNKYQDSLMSLGAWSAILKGVVNKAF